MDNDNRIVNILMVEDNPGDVRLTMEAFKEVTIPVKIEVACDGVEALDYLYKRGEYEYAITPDIVLLDLNLPKKDGKEVLSVIKSDELLKVIPVIVLTTSNAESDIMKCYQLHANSYLNKPVDFNDFFEIINLVEQFWLKRVMLPSISK